MTEYDPTYGGIGGLWFSDLRDLIQDFDEDVSDEMRGAAYAHHKKTFEQAMRDNGGTLPDNLLAKLIEAAEVFSETWYESQWNPDLGGFVVESYPSIEDLVEEHGSEDAKQIIAYANGDEFLDYNGDLKWDAEYFLKHLISDENEEEIWKWMEARRGTADLLGHNFVSRLREEVDFDEAAEQLGLKDELYMAAYMAAADGFRIGTETEMFNDLISEIRGLDVPGFIHAKKQKEGHRLWWDTLLHVYPPLDMLFAFVSDLDIPSYPNSMHPYVDVYYYGWWGRDVKLMENRSRGWEWTCDKEVANEYFPDALAQQ